MNGFAHHACAMPVSTAKAASIGSTACNSGPSIRLPWFGVISMRVPDGGRFSRPRTSTRNRSLEQQRTEIAHAALPPSLHDEPADEEVRDRERRQ